jgi:uncharacterized protein YecT (DUF1311 family)
VGALFRGAARKIRIAKAPEASASDCSLSHVSPPSVPNRTRFSTLLFCLSCSGFVTIAAAASLEAHAQGVVEECADRSPTQAALSACLDSRVADAERDLEYKAKLARNTFASMRSRELRAKTQRAFDRAQRRFFAERDQQCGGNPETVGDSDRGNKVRECIIRLTRERSAELAASFSLSRADTRAAEEQPPPARPQTPAATRPQSDPVYGVDWRLTRVIRDNKEMALPPKYKASLRLETDGRVSGYGAASAFTGRYRLRSPGRIEWAENGFLITHDAQQPDPNQIDYLYIDSLERITRAGLSKTGLVLRNEDGSISLSFER